ncbi:MAG: CBS domain-containing protein [Planctomycetes bacterium]|nr:CBS domain-containing protein [Planctomycetota bacterium]
MKVRDIMSQDLACCTPETPLQDVAQMMVERDCGAIPVVLDEDRRQLVGVVTDRDITIRLVAQGINPLDKRARDCMSSPVVSVSMDASVEEACTTLEAHQVRRMPVVDSSNGTCCGMIAQADLARYAPSSETADLVKRVSQPSPAFDSVETQPVERDRRE